MFKPVVYYTMKIGLCWMHFQISRLVHSNKTMCLQIVSNLITHKTFHHLGYMSNNRYWTVIVFVIDVTIIFKIGDTLSFFQSCSNTPDSWDLFMTLANDSEIYGADSLNNATSIPRISLFDFLGCELRYFSIPLLDILVKRKVWILFEPFQKSLVWKILKFRIHFVTDIGKMLIKIISIWMPAVWPILWVYDMSAMWPMLGAYDLSTVLPMLWVHDMSVVWHILWVFLYVHTVTYAVGT